MGARRCFATRGPAWQLWDPSMSSLVILGLCFASAAFYTGAGVVMKLGLNLPFLWLVPAILVSLAIAARIETVALHGARMGHVVVVIIAFEVLMTSLCALALGERYALRELAGFVAILIGVALLADGEAGRPAD